MEMSQVSRAISGTLVDLDRDPVAHDLGVRQAERLLVGGLAEETLAAPEHDREDHESQQLRVGLSDLGQLERVALFSAVDLEGPASMLVALASARVLHDSVERDELRDDDLAHDFLLARRVSMVVRRRRKRKLIAMS